MLVYLVLDDDRVLIEAQLDDGGGGSSGVGAWSPIKMFFREFRWWWLGLVRLTESREISSECGGITLPRVVGLPLNSYAYMNTFLLAEAPINRDRAGFAKV